jgi:ferritin-like metal-binding protein YciE
MTLDDLFRDTIRAIYNSETQLLKSMPRLRDAAQGARLKLAIGDSIRNCEKSIGRLEQICFRLGFAPGGIVCSGTLGLVEEADNHIRRYKGTPVADACYILDMERTIRYAGSNYGTAIAWAEDLDCDCAVVELLIQSLQDLEEADEGLTFIAEEEAYPVARDSIMGTGPLAAAL